MIPTFDVEIEYNYEIAQLLTGLTAEDVATGFTDHHEYECLGVTAWEEAAECLDSEETVLGQAADSDAPDGIEAVLNELSDSGDGVDYAEFNQSLHWNDAGVAGLSCALSAARAVTFYSCSGSLERGRHHARYPMVGVVPDAERAELIAELARRAGCGIGQREGCWYLYAKSVTDMHALARLILEQRGVFDAMPAPQWVYGLEEKLEEADGH
ncbi:hypothetical protein [Streptomyces sp. NPDC059893]|uniref:hypothetical protein n=1 Tax=Streptomyces sp. NPDC059893 TaxID=3346990 RepID=UPI00365AF9D9